MDEGGASPGRDARAVALARYLRSMADAFSLSADTTHSQRIAEAGMALLDAAVLAESLSGDDRRLRVLSEAGLFESLPDGEALFIEVPEIRATVQRPISSSAQNGEAILAHLVSTARSLDEGWGQAR